MPRNVSGVFSLPAGTIGVAATLANVDHVNQRFADIEAECNLPTPISAGGTAGVNIAQAQSALQIQPVNANLTAEAGLVGAADRLAYFTGVGAKALTTLTAAGRALLDDVDAATQRATLGVVIGTNVQAQDADLTALAALATTGLVARTGAGTVAARTLTAGVGIAVTNGDGVAGNPTVAALSGEASVQISGSPTAVDFPSIPSYVTKVSIVVNSVSLSTANTMQVRIGTGGTVDSTGYVGGCVTVETSSLAAGSTTGFLLATDSAAQSVNGILMLVKEPSYNNWFVSAVLNVTTTGRTLMCSGQKTIAGALTNIQFVASGGVFDGGRVTISYS